MKTFKLITVSFFFLVLGTHISIAQQTNTNQPEKYLPDTAQSNSKAKISKPLTVKPINGISTAGTSKLYSKEEVEARALTAKKSKNSRKVNISPEQAKREREARIAAIIEANKTKKKTESRRNNEGDN